MTVTVAEIYRHPIKSHGREALASVSLKAGKTMPWDRVWAVAHAAAKIGPDNPQWAMCANFSRGSKAPGLMAINAKLNEADGIVTLSHPDLGQISVNPDIPEQAQALIDWAAPAIPVDRMTSAFVTRVPGRGMTDTDYPSISILSHASLAALSQSAGQTVSPLRFRGNIWLDGLDAWAEWDMVGKTIRIGEVEFLLREPIARCAATTANPETGERDLDTLGLLRDGWGHQNFGVYGEVTKGGFVQTGDGFEVL